MKVNRASSKAKKLFPVLTNLIRSCRLSTRGLDLHMTPSIGVENTATPNETSCDELNNTSHLPNSLRHQILDATSEYPGERDQHGHHAPDTQQNRAQLPRQRGYVLKAGVPSTPHGDLRSRGWVVAASEQAKVDGVL